MLKIGITGGIGSGKTTVSKIFDCLGIPIFYADIEAKKAMHENVVLQKQLTQNFGEVIYENQKLNTKCLSNIVFNNTESLEKLNSIVHPFMKQLYNEWASRQKTTMVMKEAALLFETTAHHDLDVIIGVYCNKAERIQRVLDRDNISIEKINNIIRNQLNENIKMKLCQFIIYNQKDNFVLEQVLQVYEKLQILSSSHN